MTQMEANEFEILICTTRIPLDIVLTKVLNRIED